MQYFAEFIIFLLLLFGAVFSDHNRILRLKKMEYLNEKNFIDRIAVDVLEEPLFEKKLSLAFSAVGKYVKFCDEAFVVRKDNGFTFLYKDRFTEEDEKLVKEVILKSNNPWSSAHNNGFLLENFEAYDLHGYIIVKPCDKLTREQIEFLTRYVKSLRPIFSNARLVTALKKSRDISEKLVGRYKLLHYFIMDLQKSSTVEEAYWKLVNASLTFFGVNSATVFDVSGERKKWHFVAIKNAENNRLKKVEDVIKSSKYNGTIVEVKERKKVVYVPDVSKHEKWIPTKSSPMSWIGIPIIKGDKVIAVFSIDGKESNQFTDEDLIFARALSDMVSNIVERLSYMEKLSMYSITDSLTGLYNKRELDSRIEEEVHRAMRYGRDLSIAIFDLDRFKQWNDLYGHVEGDELLKAVGKLIKSSIRNSDIPFRFGGDEFVIIFPETDTSKASIIMKKLYNEVLKISAQKRVKVGFSAGIDEYRTGEGPEEFLQRADYALYQAKEDEEEKIKIAA
jgi:diguanylate cyclase (GGDEF)-like protein